VAYFKFDINDVNGELEAKRAVPFRLTPTLAEFITTVGIKGALTASMVAAARCLAQPSFKVINILRAILRDEMITWHKKVLDYFGILSGFNSVYFLLQSQLQQKHEDRNIQDMYPPLQGEQLVATVSKAANEICIRLNCLASLDTPQASVTGEALPHADKLLSEKVYNCWMGPCNCANNRLIF
jgi:transformation/transcription domain-associated protein